MSDQDPKGAGAERSIAEVEKELKAEMNRKLDGLKTELQQTTNQTQVMMDQYLAAITARANGNQPAAQKKLADLQYEDPDAYDREIENRAARIANDIVDKRLTSSNATQAVINTLAGDYPELKDINSDLSQEALKVYNTLPKHLIGTPEGTRMAIREAAANTGVIPVSKRPKAQESEEFSVSSGGGSRRSSSKKDEVDDKTLIFAQAIGLNVNDPKVLEGLKKNSKRDYRKLQE